MAVRPSLLARLKARALGVWKKNPVRVVTGVVALLIFAASKFGIVLPQTDLLRAVLAVLPIVFGGEIARANVTPSN